jgi:hypothetical protein
MADRIFICALLVQCIGISTAFGQPVLASGLEVENYRELEYLIENLSDGAKKLRLTENRLQNKVELRLRQAGIKPSDGSQSFSANPYLYVQANIGGRGFNVSVQFKRWMSYQVGGRTFKKFAATWDTGVTGTTNDADYVVGALDDALDIFLNAYLKANQK